MAEKNRHVWRQDEVGFICEICGMWQPSCFERVLPEFGCIDTLPRKKDVIPSELGTGDFSEIITRGFLIYD